MAPPLIPKPIERRQADVSNPRSPQSDSPFPPSDLTLRPTPTNSPQDASASQSVATATRTPRPSGTSTPRPSPTPTSSSSSNNRNGLNMNSTQTGIVTTIVAIIGVVILGFLSYVILKSIRLRYKDPKYLPGSYLKKKWKNWDVMGYQAAGGSNSGSSRNPNQARINRVARSRANVEANRALDRQNSVRSVITLPPYREMAEMDLERTIGREGERGGLDTIVQLPETADEEEDRREERMQAMYELRLQRRAQRAAREARSASGSVTTLGNDGNGGTGSSVSLTAMDMEAGGSGRTASELTAAILNDRTRRLSEVSYGDVGYARHDGSRVRSTSTNRNNGASSDSQPLLADNASGTASRRSRAGSMLSLNTNVTEGRGSMDRRDSTEMLAGADIGEARLPPSYDGLDWGDAPPYMSPVSPPVRSESAATRRRPVPGQEGQQAQQPANLNVPLVRVIGASNPNSPMSPRAPGPL
ncbi:hypothetical protein TWF730_009969 [Orbilia blumenaviensis]|uniref:Uncharacterized protein n=1 Tax=Orbilia blumenaviensis TaxID=1796055 RepID=A0AAV9UUQ6_9PEZI